MALTPMAQTPGAPAPRYLYGPWTDFLLLGGSSLIIFPLLWLLPVDRASAPLDALTLALLNVLNHPHFAQSYQIFYRRFGEKAFGASLPVALRWRYRIAGLIVPAALALGMALAVASGEARLLGYAGNLMVLLVGWHYVKQGYGMLMVDAALKGFRFSDRARKLLVANGYAVWAFAWVNGNHLVKSHQLWNLHYYAFDLPAPLLTAAILAAAATTALTLWVLAQAWRAERRLPWTGVVAYAVSLYAWLAFVGLNPLWLMVVSGLHSLQYMAVVGRYQANLETAAVREQANPPPHAVALRLGRFALTAMLLGAVFFWCAPLWLSVYAPYDRAVFGATMFMFMFWVFMNVHHFFLDNVMWKRENPDVRRFLFG
jgi:hypothetical protein